MKKSHRFLIWFIYFIMMAVAFDVTDFLIERNLLSTWYVFLIEMMFLFLGWFGARLEIKLAKNKNNKQTKKTD
ncbi:MAG: hypothetical protein J6W40_02905 [Alphaproteobacteria bacterium]|nr:hypothetical protein [Alphaproteobacteria bacterium]